jgi:hypothetical protein
MRTRSCGSSSTGYAETSSWILHTQLAGAKLPAVNGDVLAMATDVRTGSGRVVRYLAGGFNIQGEVVARLGKGANHSRHSITCCREHLGLFHITLQWFIVIPNLISLIA